MVTKIDFPKDFPAPKEALDRMNEIINRHGEIVQKDHIPIPSIDD